MPRFPKCPHCGKDISIKRKKLTLRVDEKLVSQAYAEKMSISSFVEEQLRKYLDSIHKTK